jgi:hypothetical protein
MMRGLRQPCTSVIAHVVVALIVLDGHVHVLDLVALGPRTDTAFYVLSHSMIDTSLCSTYSTHAPLGLTHALQHPSPAALRMVLLLQAPHDGSAPSTALRGSVLLDVRASDHQAPGPHRLVAGLVDERARLHVLRVGPRRQLPLESRPRWRPRRPMADLGPS